MIHVDYFPYTDKMPNTILILSFMAYLARLLYNYQVTPETT